MNTYILESGEFKFSCTDTRSVPPPTRLGYDALQLAMTATLSGTLVSAPGDPNDVFVSFRGNSAINVADLAEGIDKARDILSQDMNRLWIKGPGEQNTTLVLQDLTDPKYWVPTPKGGHEVVGWVMKDDGNGSIKPFECTVDAGAQGAYLGYLCYSYTLSEPYETIP